MKKTLVIIISFLSLAFFCVRGAFFSVCPLAVCARGLNLPKNVKNQCVSEAYLYKSSSGCKVVGFSGDFYVFFNFCGAGEFFNFSKETFCGESGFCGLNKKAETCGIFEVAKSVKGERFFLPAEAFSKSGLRYEEFCGFFVKNLGAKKVFCEQAEGAYNEYYYSRAIKNYSVINGKRVNLQISKTGAGVSVASPIAFGSY